MKVNNILDTTVKLGQIGSAALGINELTNGISNGEGALKSALKGTGTFILGSVLSGIIGGSIAILFGDGTTEENITSVENWCAEKRAK